MADAVDVDLYGPRDLGAGVEQEVADEAVGGAATTFQERSRTTTTVRITNPEDETQYVDVERLKTVTFVGAGTTLTFIYSN